MSRLMLRTRHHRLDSGAGARIRLAQLDASGRAAAARVEGVKLFVWGDLLEGCKSSLTSRSTRSFSG